MSRCKHTRYDSKARPANTYDIGHKPLKEGKDDELA
jgi:hypothetical protein